MQKKAKCIWSFTCQKNKNKNKTNTKLSADFFHSSLPIIIFRHWICNSMGGCVFLWHLVLVLHLRDWLCPSWMSKELAFCTSRDSWRRFCVGLRIKGRTEGPGIKKHSKGGQGWGWSKIKRQWRRKFRNLNHWIWMIQGHLHSQPISSTLDPLKNGFEPGAGEFCD